MEYKYKLDYHAIAKRVKAARKAAQMTQAELAEKVDVSTNAVAKLEANLMKVSLQTLVNIANVLDVDLNYLLADSTDIDGNTTNTDMFLESLIRNLSMRDKTFIVHVKNDEQELIKSGNYILVSSTESKKEINILRCWFGCVRRWCLSRSPSRYLLVMLA